ncbi:hypothetical protein Tco_0410035 [Tanacetum coccineum]
MAALKFASSHNMVKFLANKPTEKQFWATIKVKTVNREVQIQALVDKKKVIITETSVRSDLQLKDVEVFLDKQVEGMSKHKEIYVTPSHTKKVFANMKSLSKRVLDLEKTKTSQAAEITELKERVKKLEKKKGSKTYKLKRLYKGRKIDEIYQDVKVTLVDETQGRNDEEMFNTGILDGEEVFAEQDMVKKEVKIKAAKPKAVTTAATTTTTAVIRPKARGVVVQEPNAELEEEEKLARQREEDANIAEWDNVQAMMCDTPIKSQCSGIPLGVLLHRSGYKQKDRKPSQNDKTEHGMEKTVQNQGQSPKMPKFSNMKNQQSTGVGTEESTIECILYPSNGRKAPIVYL